MPSPIIGKIGTRAKKDQSLLGKKFHMSTVKSAVCGVKFLLIPVNGVVKRLRQIILRSSTNSTINFMKKSFVTVLLIISCTSIMAQTGKGTFSLGGLIGVSSGINKTLGTKREDISVSVAPAAGFFVADKMELGLYLSFGYTREKADGDELGTYKTAGLGPYFKYYLFTSNEQFAFTLNTSMVFGISKRDFPADSFNRDATGNNFQFSFSPGFSYFFTGKIGLDFELRGITVNYSDPDGDTDDDESTYLTIGASSLNPSLGFKYYFAR